MARSRKQSRRSRKTRRGGGVLDTVKGWFGYGNNEEVVDDSTTGSSSTTGNTITGSVEQSETVGGRHRRGRKHRKTRRAH